MMQEGFIKVFTQIHQFRGQGALEGWIRRIVVHTCINVLKKNKKFTDSVDLFHAGSMYLNENNIPSILQAKQVVECIRLLPVGYKTVLNLYAIEGYSHKEIGAILDIEESTSRSQYTRAKSSKLASYLRLEAGGLSIASAIRDAPPIRGAKSSYSEADSLFMAAEPRRDSARPSARVYGRGSSSSYRVLVCATGRYSTRRSRPCVPHVCGCCARALLRRVSRRGRDAGVGCSGQSVDMRFSRSLAA